MVDMGSIRLKPSPSLDSRLEQLGRNALTRIAMSAAKSWVLPTHVIRQKVCRQSFATSGSM